MLNTVLATSHVPSSQEPDILGEARQSKVNPGQTTLRPNSPDSYEDEGELHTGQ